MANIRKSLKTLVLFVLAVAMIFTNMSIALPVVSAADDTSSETYVTEIKGANMTIGQDLSLNYYATLADEHKDATMHFVMSNGKEVNVKGVYDAKQGVYKFTLNAIPPQTMGDTIDATLKLGDEVLDEHTGYSVKAYAQSQFTKYPNDAELKQLLTDMLYYGEAAQLYRNYETDALVTNDVQDIGTPSDESILPTESGMLNQVDPNTTARFTSAGVWFDYNNRLYIKFNATEGVTVKVNGETVTFDGAMYNTNGIYAVDFDKVYTFELYEGETLANRIEYSIKTYVYNTMNKKGEDGQLTNMAKLVRALYAYGKSAEAYRDAKPENVIVGDNSATTIVIPTLDNKVSSAVSMSTENGAITAYVPAGVALATDTDTLTLKVNDMADSKAEISLEKTESAFSINVHIDGISANNDVATKITIKELLPVGLNMGNYRFYHVENGETVEMILLADGATPVHNNFEYDPATGDVVLYLTSFSEIALVADTKNAWNGEYDYTWYDVDKKELTIANADQLAAFGAIVGGMAINVKQEDDTTKTIERDSFKDKTVKLLADINLGDAEKENNSNIIFYPIGYYNSTGSYEKTSGETVTSEVYSFEGTFDGNGNTISNFYQNTWEMKGDYNDGYPAGSNHYKDAMGLFGYVNGGTIKNLTVDNFSTDGEFTPTGVIAAYADGNSNFENIAITNCNPRVYNTGNGGIIGIAGSTSAANDDHIVLKNITVDNSNKISALWGSWDVACGGLVGMYRGNVDGDGNATDDTISFENCHVAAQIDVYNDVCANYQYYAYRYAGMMIGSIRHNKTENGYAYPNMEGITASDCTVHFGTWNDYYYCELVDNTIASYTHDYQMSRLVEIKAINGTTITYLDDTTGTVPVSGRANYVIVDYTKGHGTDNATCYHFLDGEVWNHEDGGKETTDINGDGNVDSSTLKEDKQHIYLEFNQLFTGYGWGVSSKGLTDFEGIENMDITEGDQEESVEKFKSKFTGDFLYRVGNQNAVALGSLFGSADDVTIDMSGFYVSIENIAGNAAGEFTSNATWTNGTIQFSGTGVVKVTIQDYKYCKPTELYLEVVDAVNATAATSATENNVVLLNDISGGFTVSGRYTVFGNGFTLNYTGNGQYLNNGLRQGLITVSENGTLDNLRIKASIYPTAFMYYGTTQLGDYVQQSTNPKEVEGDKTRYYYQLSAVVAKGNATISNCYIYGARTNIFVDTGDVTIKDTILECGTVANVQIQSTNEYTVTLDNVTTIQYQVNATVGDTSKIMLGAGVLVGPDTTSNPHIVLNDNFKQYNWVTEDDKDAVSAQTAQMLIDGALNATDYNHTVNGKTASNLGIVYMNTEDIAVTNKTELPYVKGCVTMTVNSSTVNGNVYSLQSAAENQIYSDYENADRSTVNGDYLPTFEFDLGDQEISYDGSEDTRYLYGDANGITALYKDGEDPLTLDLTKLATIYKYKGISYDVTVVCKNSSGNALTTNNGVVTLDAQDSYTITFTVDDNIFYDKDGQTITKSVTREFSVPLTLTVKAADVKNAVVNITKTALDGVYTTVNLTDYKLCINFLDCISITDYDNNGTGTTVDLESNISSATLTPSGVNVFTTASTVTVTYTDGRVLTVNLSKISGSSPGTKTATVNTSGGLYFITDGALDNKPTEASSQNKCTITSVSYKGNSGSTVTNDTDVTVTWALGSSGGSNPCITPDTLVTLADGTQVRVDSLTGNEELLVWNHETGKLDKAPVAYIVNHDNVVSEREIIHLTFANGKTVKIIGEHVFFDATLNQYVAIDTKNVDAFIGHAFVSLKADGTSVDKTELVSVSREVTETTVYEVVSYKHLTCFTEGILSTSAFLDPLLNVFDINSETLAYDAEKVQHDIETYGLYTYADFEGLISEEAFELYNAAYLKIAVGKGYITWDDILELIDIYFNVGVTPIEE